MSYRPITDVWILARTKVRYYGAYPAGFLHRARALLGVCPDDSVLHVCGGRIRDYPFRGVGAYDKTLDLDPACQPDFLQDAREPFPAASGSRAGGGYWDAVLIDRPYTPDDADKYVPGRAVLPSATCLLRNALAVVPIGGKVGILDYTVPRPPKPTSFVALIGVWCGYENRMRAYSVFERRA